MSDPDETAGWQAAREAAVPEKGGLTLPVPGGGEIFFRKIPAGRFLMGARGENEDEEPVTEQVVPEFYLGTFPVTQRQFRAWTASEEYKEWWEKNQELVNEDGREKHRNEFEGNDLAPAERVTWDEAMGFAKWLGRQEKFCGGLRAMGLDSEAWEVTLPGEGQWESACRGESRTEYSLGEGKEVLAKQGWFDENAGRKTHAVGMRAEGPHKLYEMHGNVQEWCQDYFHEKATRELQWGSEVRLRLDRDESAEVPWVWRESERFFEKVVSGDRAVNEEDRRILEVWKEEFSRQENEEFTRVFERALLQNEDEVGRWPGEDQGVAQGILGWAKGQGSTAASGSRRVNRGGSWFLSASDCRSAVRSRSVPGVRFGNRGFRLCLSSGPVENQPASPEGREAERRREREGGTTDRASGGGEASSAKAPVAKAEGADDEWSEASFSPRSGGEVFEDAVVVSSVDGERWYEERTWDGGRHSGESRSVEEKVVKVVLGTLKENEADFGFALDDLREVKRHFPDLRQLCLWGIKGLTELDGLPEGLVRLEVRNCPDFVTLGELPGGLKSLDVGGCGQIKRLPALPEGLEELYLNRCPGLDKARLTVLLEDSALENLKEVNGSETVAFERVDWLPDGIERVRFQKCPGLKEVEKLAGCDQLEVLNLQDCPKLEQLGELPSGLPHLVVSGCEALTRFAGSGLSEPERGKEGSNVAEHFLGLQKYGDERELWAAAKILLLGDGRVGKSTLAKRLQWEELEDQAVHPELRPDRDEDPTHAIRYFDWETQFEVGEGALGRAGESEVTGQAAIWDFGGQELYHQTHRLFAGSGSVFLIVWRDGEPDFQVMAGDCPEEVPAGLWRELNRRRSLQYWLDYVYAIRPDAEVALVCTDCPAGKERPDWKAQAPDFAGSKRAKELRVFFVDSLHDEHAHDPDFVELRQWLREAMGRMAVSLGLVKPKFFVEVAEEVGKLRLESEAENGPEVPIWKWRDWEERMASWYEDRVGRGNWSARDAEVITSYLHDRGTLFRIRRDGQNAVMVDQVRGTKLIYALLEPGKAIFKAVREHRGWFTLAELERVPDWQCLKDNEVAREQVLDFIKQCGLLLEMEGRDERYFIANHRWLLPAREDLQRSYGSLLDLVLERDGNEKRETFSFEAKKISEFEFAQLRLHLAREWRRAAFLGADQLAFFDPEVPPEWVFWVDYEPDEEGSYYGRVDAHLSAPGPVVDRLREDFEFLFHLPGSPFEENREARFRERSEEKGKNLLEGLGCFRNAEIGLSSSGRDRETAVKIKEALEDEGWKVVWYGDENCREGEDRKVEHFMKVALGQTKVRLILLSDNYLRPDLKKNWYCPWELADRILQCADDPRELGRTLVVYLKSSDQPEIDSQSVTTEVSKLFGRLGESFKADYDNLSNLDDALNGEHLIQTMRHFALARREVKQFFDERSNRGWYSRADEKEGALDLEGLIADVREALKVK